MTSYTINSVAYCYVNIIYIFYSGSLSHHVHNRMGIAPYFCTYVHISMVYFGGRLSIQVLNITLCITFDFGIFYCLLFCRPFFVSYSGYNHVEGFKTVSLKGPHVFDVIIIGLSSIFWVLVWLQPKWMFPDSLPQLFILIWCSSFYTEVLILQVI